MLGQVIIDCIGLMAGVFVILAFYAHAARPLRAYAILSNLLFMLYAALEALLPVLLLHAILLPLNFAHLRQIEKCQQRSGDMASPGE